MKKKLIAVTLLIVSLACSIRTSPDFEAYLPADRVDTYVQEQLAKSNKAYFKINGESIRIVDMDFDDDSLIFLFEEGAILLGFSMKKMKFNGKAEVLYGRTHPKDGFQETQRFNKKKLKKTVSYNGTYLKGNLESKEMAIELEVLINVEFVGAGTSELEVRDDGNAYLRGILGTRAYVQIRNLLERYPKVKTIVFEEVEGSVNDSINVHTGRLIRNAGLNTRINASGIIASGGVDLFVAGNRRLVELGAQIGVHSWCCAESLTADKLPREHEGHRSQVEYFSDMLGTSGEGFYFFTLMAAPFDGIHWMDQYEITRWGIATEIL